MLGDVQYFEKNVSFFLYSSKPRKIIDNPNDLFSECIPRVSRRECSCLRCNHRIHMIRDFVIRKHIGKTFEVIAYREYKYE